MTAHLTEARNAFHRVLTERHTLCLNEAGVASNADGSQATSRFIAAHIAATLDAPTVAKKLDGQRAGTQFEQAVHSFLDSTVREFPMLRPGMWSVEQVGNQRAINHIARYEPYRHLDDLAAAVQRQRELASVLGNSYEISPDVLIVRQPEPDDHINAERRLVDEVSARRTIIRGANQSFGIIHAVVSCKWTLRSDRAQNARSEALNMIRNRKGRTPHIAVVTGEPTPSRLASLALGTGDVDMVYHFALTELENAVTSSKNDEAISMLDTLISGNRLRDISDLPLDLTV